MLQKIKNTKTTSSHELSANVQKAGLMLMTLAAVMGMIELPHHKEKEVITPNQPTFAVEARGGESMSPQRREREETGPHYISYSVAQRTPSRTGTL